MYRWRCVNTSTYYWQHRLILKLFNTSCNLTIYVDQSIDEKLHSNLRNDFRCIIAFSLYAIHNLYSVYFVYAIRSHTAHGFRCMEQGIEYCEWFGLHIVVNSPVDGSIGISTRADVAHPGTYRVISAREWTPACRCQSNSIVLHAPSSNTERSICLNIKITWFIVLLYVWPIYKSKQSTIFRRWFVDVRWHNIVSCTIQKDFELPLYIDYLWCLVSITTFHDCSIGEYTTTRYFEDWRNKFVHKWSEYSKTEVRLWQDFNSRTYALICSSARHQYVLIVKWSRDEQ